MHELGAIAELVGRAGTYAHLRFAVDTADPAIGALLRASGSAAPRSRPKLLFFELEWAALDDERADELLADRRPRLLPATTCAPRAATARTC